MGGVKGIKPYYDEFLYFGDGRSREDVLIWLKIPEMRIARLLKGIENIPLT